MLINPPLSLYIHIPWCVQKCPYCDFNSHALKHDIPEQDYVQHLLNDLDADISRFSISRPLHSIFIGGGTPSLLSSQALETLITGVLSRFEYSPDIEITLEANPGTVEAGKFEAFAQAGISRLSVGVQSFGSDKLITLGRIHDAEQAKNAVKQAKTSGVKSVNLDLMHGLPKQQIAHALDDLKTAISLNVDHLSWYQLTIEPNTAFYSKPPILPDDDQLWEIQLQGAKLLESAGYQQYEISGYSKTNKQCQHNLNYWQYGDYLGIGCGAHGKITDEKNKTIVRTVKVKHPKGYMESNRAYLDQLTSVNESERPFEFMMNQLRLFSSFSAQQFEHRTGLPFANIMPLLAEAEQKSLMQEQTGLWRVTPNGHRYLNDLLTLFI